MFGNNSRKIIEPPLRAELFSVDQLIRHGSLMGSTQVVAISKCSNGLLKRLRQNEDVLRCYQKEAQEGDQTIQATPAAEWLLDNFYLVEEQIQMARRHLPRGYSQELPRLLDGPLKGYPRVYELVVELISHLDALMDAQSLKAFLESYQTVVPLQLGELWAIPIMLRLALIENLRRISVLLSEASKDRARANVWIDRMQVVSESDPSQIVVVVAEMAKADVKLSRAFIAAFCQRITRQNAALYFSRDWLEHKLELEGKTIEGYIFEETQMQAANQASVRNTIASLRFLKVTNWKDFVEGISHTELMLRDDPAGIYPLMDFATRDRYRHAVEAFAKHSKYSELEVAHQVIELAQSGNSTNGEKDRSGHVGFYLIDEGQKVLE